MTLTYGPYRFVNDKDEPYEDYEVFFGSCRIGQTWNAAYHLRWVASSVIRHQQGFHTKTAAAKAIHADAVRNVAQFFTRGIFILGREGIA